MYNSFEFIIGPTHLNSASCLPTMLDGQLTWSEDGTHENVWILCWPWAWSTILVSLILAILAADLEVWNSLRTNLSKHLGIELETSRVCCVHWVRSVKVQKRGAAVRCHRIIEKRFPQTRNSTISCFCSLCSFCHGFIFLDSGLGAVQWGFLRYFHVFCFERGKFSARRPRNDAMTRHIAATHRNYSRCETWEFIALRFTVDQLWQLWLTTMFCRVRKIVKSPFVALPTGRTHGELMSPVVKVDVSS